MFEKKKSRSNIKKTVPTKAEEKEINALIKDITVLKQKVRNDQGVITGFHTSDDVVLSVDQIAEKLIALEDIQALNREGVMSKLTVIDGQILTPDGHNLGHLPDHTS